MNEHSSLFKTAPVIALALFRVALLSTALLGTALLSAACSGAEAPGIIWPSGGTGEPGNNPGKAERQGQRSTAADIDGPKGTAASNAASDLERIAEIERAGAFFPGLALTESAAIYGFVTALILIFAGPEASS